MFDLFLKTILIIFDDTILKTIETHVQISVRKGKISIDCVAVAKNIKKKQCMKNIAYDLSPTYIKSLFSYLIS